MKQLLLMRHAEAKRHAEDGSDEHRPLHRRGIADVHKVGAHLQDHAIRPQLIVHSTATRTTETAWTLCEELDPSPMTEGLDHLYLTPDEDILQTIRRTEPTVDTLMIVGHNPGIGDLALAMVDNPTGTVRAFPTASVAVIDMDINDWSAAGRGHLKQFILADELE